MADKKDITQPWEKLGVGPTGMGQIPAILDVVWAMQKKLTVCLVGETGIGKTPLVHQWCKSKNGFMYPLNFGHMSQEEVSMIMFTEKGDSFDFVPPQWMLDLNTQAEQKGCAVLFLDEWNRGDKAMVNALFTLTDERRVHSFQLHPNVLVVAAMNPSDGSYLVNEAEKDHAIRKRLNFVYCVHDLQSFLEHVKNDQWHPLVPAFIKAASTYLYDVGARDAGKAFACPSNWEKVSGILKAAKKQNIPYTDSAVCRLIDGQVGSHAGEKFMEFVQDQNTLIQPAEILKDYTYGSPIRSRVAAVLNCAIDKETRKFVEKENKQKTRASVIADVSKGVAIELFSLRPTPAQVAPKVALYIHDLPNELLQTLVTELGEQCKAKGDIGDKYLGQLSSELAKIAEYKTKMKFIVDIMREYRTRANPNKEIDPMA